MVGRSHILLLVPTTVFLSVLLVCALWSSVLGRISTSLTRRTASVSRSIFRGFFLLLLLSHRVAVESFLILPPTIPVLPCRPSATAIMGIKGFRGWFEGQFPHAIHSLPKETSSDTFDHVLIDMNQMLHVVLRKSRSEGHALVLLMKELDSTIQFCQPTQSLVLAMDGPPSAAKLATQRKRRLATVLKSEYKSKQIRKIIETLQGRTSRTALQKLRKWRRKERRNQADVRTLAITPSTAFMQRAEAALLYWAWQRLTARSNKLCENNVRIFVSNSLHAGEGEVKLIEWVLSKPRKGESIAILGGDTDLVLESLLIPVASTHNAFVLLQDGAKRYLSVSLWETTRALRRIFGIDRIADILYIRTDLVLLLMLNGNDYLPKLRGSSGFNRLFHWYLKLQREWRKQGKKEAYLVDPDTLNFNIDFCLEFFGKLAALQPTNLWSAKTARKITDQSTPLQQLHNLVEGEFLPSPIEFVVIREGSNEDQEYVSVNAQDGEDDNAVSSDDDEEEEEEDILDDCTDDDDDPSDTDDQILVRLSLGHPGSEDFLTYEIWHPKGASFRSARQRLAGVALTDMMDEQSDSEEDEDNEFGFVSPRYDWEITVAEGDCDSFLYGLLWTIQTYLTGVCPDYSYNYGKRMSPTAREITDVFERAKAENRSIGPKDLRSAPSTSSIPAGLSCLAALPSNIKHLVPDPYKFLDDEVIEDFYGRCVDLKTNVFDIKRFERLCEVQLREMGHNVDGSDSPFDDQYWTLLHMVPKSLTKPMTPPEPFSDRLDKLKKHPRMRMTKIEAKRESLLSSPRTEGDTLHSDPGLFLSRVEHIDRVDYRVVYQANNRKIRKGSRTDKKLTNRANSTNSNTATKAASPKIERKVDTPGDKGPQMKEFNVQELPAAIPRNTEGLSALSILNCLSDSKEIGTVEWISLTPSTSEFASYDPEQYELVRLKVASGDLDLITSNGLQYDQDRQVNSQSRKALLQHLASSALSDIVGPSIKWDKMTLKELRAALRNVKSAASKP